MKALKHIICFLVITSLILAKPVTSDEIHYILELSFPNKHIQSSELLNQELYLSTFTHGGFVLSSADDGFPVILAYSEQTKPGHNPAFFELCKNYAEQIDQTKSPDRPRHSDWTLAEQGILSKSTARASVDPLITTIWNQAPHYNDKFPTFILPGYSTQKAYAGCVAIVLGQLMNYYEHPSRGYGKRWYYSETTGTDMFAYFDTTLYDYENMPDSLCNAYGILTVPTDQLNDVSLFLLQCATAVEMEFQPAGSSASYEDMMYALRSHFDYNIDMQLLLKADYTDAIWNNMIKEELDNGHPLPYRGQGEGGGHAFLLDGYQVSTNTYFHFNWGWGGAYDGWFMLSALDPTEGYDFTDNQAAIFNIRPNPDNITRYAHTSFEGLEAGWSYDGAGFYPENGSADMVHTGELAYGFDGLDQWLVSPKIHVPNDNGASLNIWAHMVNSGKQCKVFLSNTDTLRDHFTIELGTISPSTSAWNEYAYSLRPYKNTDVYIGIYFNQSSGYISIDDFSVTRPKVITSTERTLPDSPDLFSAYPNPFNPTTNIHYKLSELSDIKINIYDLQGKHLASLLDQKQEAGQHHIIWNASNYPSGIYICSLKINNNLLGSQKLLLVK